MQKMFGSRTLLRIEGHYLVLSTTLLVGDPCARVRVMTQSYIDRPVVLASVVVVR